jgi:hypothetical protein
MGLGKVGWGVDWIHPALDEDQWICLQWLGDFRLLQNDKAPWSWLVSIIIN